MLLGIPFVVALFFLWPFLAIGLYFFMASTCSTEMIARYMNVPNLMVEDGLARCGFLGRAEFRTISVSRGPGLLNWFGKEEIAMFSSSSDPKVPIEVIAVDKHTVRLILPEVDQMIFRDDRWGDITIIYD